MAEYPARSRLRCQRDGEASGGIVSHYSQMAAHSRVAVYAAGEGAPRRDRSARAAANMLKEAHLLRKGTDGDPRSTKRAALELLERRHHAGAGQYRALDRGTRPAYA